MDATTLVKIGFQPSKAKVAGFTGITDCSGNTALKETIYNVCVQKCGDKTFFCKHKSNGTSDPRAFSRSGSVAGFGKTLNFGKPWHNYDFVCNGTPAVGSFAM